MLRKQVIILAGALLLVALMTIGLSIPTYALDERQCLSCHGDPELVRIDKQGEAISLYVPNDNLNTSAHRFIDCTTCHTKDPHKVVTPLDKISLAEKCGSCHEYQYKLHKESVHGEQLANGNQDVATCVDCHSEISNPHSVIRVLEYSSSTYRKNIAGTCAKCHDDESLMNRYGILEKVYETYQRSFHGKAMELGTYEYSQLDKATCINCHGTHDIQSVNNQDSPVAGMENLAKTCEQCHPGAGIKFASSFLGHKEVSPEESTVVYYAEKFFVTLTTSVIAFAGVIALLAAIRWSRNRWRV